MINLDISKALLWGGLSLALLLAAGGGWWYVSSLQGEVTRLKALQHRLTAERDEAARIAGANAATIHRVKADAARELAAVKSTLDTVRRLQAQSLTIHEEIRHAPVSAQFCPVDPALLLAVERLRR